MTNLFHATILGAIQGLAEFLPISSSGHLVAIPYIFNWNYQGLDFDIALHAGTAFAIILFFWRDWVGILQKTFVKNQTKNFSPNIENYPKNIFWQILIASIPAAIVGFLIEDLVEAKLHSILFLAFNFLFFGFLLWYSDKKSKSDLKPMELTYRKTFIIGLSQSIALIPGVSRSGITLTASRWIGLSREEAARFSFLLATPAIVGAFVLKLPKISQEGIGLPFAIGIVSATITGLLAIKFFLHFLKKSNLSTFFWYRALIALLLIVIFFTR